MTMTISSARTCSVSAAVPLEHRSVRIRADRRSAAVYRRRRAMVGGVTAFIAAVSILTAHDVLVGPGGVPASASSGQLARSTVVAQPGDTLWSIATEHRGDVPISRYVDKLVELNDGAGIQAGQRIVLP